MKFSGCVGFFVAMGFVLVGLTSCRGAGLSNVVDDVGRAMKNSADEIPPPVKNADEVIPPALGNLDTQAPEVVKVESISEARVKAVMEEAGNQLIEVSIDCATGEIKPSGAIDPSQQGSVVEVACQQISENVDAVPSEKRVVQAGEGYANLRSTPSTETTTIAHVPNGSSVQIIEQKQNSSGGIINLTKYIQN